MLVPEEKVMSLLWHIALLHTDCIQFPCDLSLRLPDRKPQRQWSPPRAGEFFLVLIGSLRCHTFFGVCCALELERPSSELQSFSFPLNQSKEFKHVAKGVRRWFEGPGCRRMPSLQWVCLLRILAPLCLLCFVPGVKRVRSTFSDFLQVKRRNKSIPLCHWLRALMQNDTKS